MLKGRRLGGGVRGPPPGDINNKKSYLVRRPLARGSMAHSVWGPGVSRGNPPESPGQGLGGRERRGQRVGTGEREERGALCGLQTANPHCTRNERQRSGFLLVGFQLTLRLRSLLISSFALKQDLEPKLPVRTPTRKVGKVAIGLLPEGAERGRSKALALT